MYALSILSLALAPLMFSEGSYVDTMKKCSVIDTGCLKDSYQRILSHIGENGLSELNIAAVDPMHIKHLNMTFLEDFRITITDGVINGIKKCIFNKFEFDLEKGKFAEEFTCDTLTLKSQFKIEGAGAALGALIGGNSLNGQGSVKVKLEKLRMSYKVPVSVVKKEDGENYIVVDQEKTKYTYNLEKATFNFKNFVIEKNDISELMTTYMNDNWKNIFNTFGKALFDKVTEIYFSFSNNFFLFVPAKKYILEDLTSYVKN